MAGLEQAVYRHVGMDDAMEENRSFMDVVGSERAWDHFETLQRHRVRHMRS
jgi:hypothetical protein